MEAFRLRTLPLSFSSILAGSAIALLNNSFNWGIFIFTLLTTLLLQVLSNLANDYGDAIHGADHQGRKGPERMVSSGRITGHEMKNALILFSILSFLSGAFLLFLSFNSNELVYAATMLLVGLLAIWAAIRYTVGSNPYGYAGLGDLFVLLFFGLTGVIGTLFLQFRSFNWTALLPAIGIGLFAVGVLNVNNMRDIQSDEDAGKRSIPVRLGLSGARKYHYTLVIGGMVLMIVYAWNAGFELINWLFLLAYPILIIHLIKIASYRRPEEFDPQLKVLSLGSFLLSLLWFLGTLA
jgi:1,4-dihydroxy-2-naphthoate octaprenyltransferase